MEGRCLSSAVPQIQQPTSVLVPVSAGLNTSLTGACTGQVLSKDLTQLQLSQPKIVHLHNSYT